MREAISFSCSNARCTLGILLPTLEGWGHCSCWKCWTCLRTRCSSDCRQGERPLRQMVGRPPSYMKEASQFHHLDSTWPLPHLAHTHTETSTTWNDTHRSSRGVPIFFKWYSFVHRLVAEFIEYMRKLKIMQAEIQLKYILFWPEFYHGVIETNKEFFTR